MDRLVETTQTFVAQYFNLEPENVYVSSLDAVIKQMETMMTSFSLLMGSVASHSLFVGGIGIMNMMLVSVTERTSEIGLRKALGARPRSIQVQFLMESIILSLLGGLIGVVLGLMVSMLLASLMDIAFVLSPGAIALGVGFSLAVGVVFGWAPARKASNLNPIDALRSL